MAVCFLTLRWLLSGPFFHWSDTWQLFTLSNIVAMLMLFLIKITQNRDTAALQLKLDELLRAMQGSQNAFINLEELNTEDVIRIKECLRQAGRNGADEIGPPPFFDFVLG
jgi:low affinity Fe/Cu permease